MPTIRHQSWRFPATALPDQDKSPAAVYHRGHCIDCKPLERSFHHAGAEESRIGFFEDEKSRNDDQHTFQNRAEKLGLMMTKRVIVICWTRRNADCCQSGKGCGQIYRAL